MGPVTLDNIPFDYVNFMSYDTPCSSMWDNCPADESFPLDMWKYMLETYKNVSEDPQVREFLRANTQVGFEPDPQFGGGKHPSEQVVKDVLKYVKDNCYGGVFTWAINSDMGNGAKGQGSVQIHEWFSQIETPDSCSKSIDSPTKKPTESTGVPTSRPTSIQTQQPTLSPTSARCVGVPPNPELLSVGVSETLSYDLSKGERRVYACKYSEIDETLTIFCQKDGAVPVGVCPENFPEPNTSANPLPTPDIPDIPDPVTSANISREDESSGVAHLFCAIVAFMLILNF